jgi:hypothetical protein
VTEGILDFYKDKAPLELGASKIFSIPISPAGWYLCRKSGWLKFSSFHRNDIFVESVIFQDTILKEQD